MLVLYPPRLGGERAYLLANLVWAACMGFVGVIVAEIARKFLPGQAGVDAEEESSLTDAEMAQLAFRRRLARFAAPVVGFAFPLLIYPWPESFSLAVATICIYWAFAFWVFAEICLSLSPRQQALTRLLRKRPRQ